MSQHCTRMLASPCLLLSISLLILASSCKKNNGGNGGSSPSISGLDCSSVSYSASATANTAYSATATVPYAGGNGVVYLAGTAIQSTGVTGLTATLQAGTLSSGNGNLSYSISGTPNAAGIAIFPIAFGGQNCSIHLTVNTSGGGGTKTVYDSIYGAYSITYDANYVYIKTYDLPDHKSIYYATSNPLYEFFSGTTFGGNTFVKNPNSIISQNGTFKIPLNPTAASTHQATPLGPIGIALNGVPFFNQYAGPSQPLTNEVVSFDQAWGHPQQSGMYHYHVEPLYLTTVKASKSALLGFLLDGFPVYGPEENGTTLTSSNLDAYHGHSHATTEYPNGIYHYHFTADAPYLNGNGFWGTPGTVTQ
jgi:hypothetical protein